MIHNISRFIAALAIILLTAQTAGATNITTHITYAGLTADDVTFTLSGNGTSFELKNGEKKSVGDISDFYVNFTITCSSALNLTSVSYSGEWEMSYWGTPSFNKNSNNGCTFKWGSMYGALTLNINVSYSFTGYTVHFEPNENDGGIGTMSDQAIATGEATALSPCTFTNSFGIPFLAWSTSADGSGTAYADQQSVTDLAATGQTVTLYALWGNGFFVHYDANGGTGTMSNQLITAPGNGYLKANAFTRTGYVFTGWNTASDGSGTAYADGKNVYNLLGRGQTLTLYAQWEPYYTVHFNANGGSGTMSDQTIGVGQAQALTANTFTRDGYYFAGWNTQANGTGTTYNDGHSVTDLAAANETFTLYAQWKEQVTADYVDANGDAHTLTDCKEITSGHMPTSLAGNYIVSESVTYTSKVTLSGNTTIILANGKTMSIGTEAAPLGGDYALYASGTNSLTIYGQSLDAATAGRLEVYSTWGAAVRLYEGSYAQHSGNVVVSRSGGSNNNNAINAGGSVTIDGGKLDASITSEGSFAINASGNISISGGSVTANATGADSYGIKAKGNITLSWTRATDRITASGYQSTNGTISLSKRFAFDDGGTVTQATTDNIGGKTLRPAALVTFNANGGSDVAAQTLFVGTAATEPTPTRTGYDLSGWTLGNADYDFATLVTEDITLTAQWTPDPAHFSQDGDTYTIKSAAGWNVFCDCLNDNDTYNRFSGKTVRLADNITVSRMAGSSKHDFCGTFDGGGNTLTFNYGTSDSYASDEYTAPFCYVSTVTPSGGSEVPTNFRNLHVSGDIYTTAKYAAGLIARQWGTVNVENCRSSIVVHSNVTNDQNGGNDGTHGGFVSVQQNGTLSFTGCTFDGKLLTDANNATTRCGGFVGYLSGGTTNITNCLYAPADLADGETEVVDGNSATFVRNGAPAVTNCYYTAALGTPQGKATRTVAAATDVTIDAVALTGTATQYTVSGITAYSGGGLQRGETLYYGSDDQLSLTLSTSAQCDQPGYQYGYTASAGTLSGTTLTMPDEDVTISTALAPIDWATVNEGDSADPYMIYNKDQLLLLAHRVNGTNGETAVNNGYRYKYFKLGADITFDHPVAEPDDYAENYEAIGTYIGGTYRNFKGNFDGDGHTVSGIRIRKTGSGDANSFQGLFGHIDGGANIHDVHLTDARITGYEHVGGIAGLNYGTVSGCSVTDSDITATENWYYGTICGWNGGTLTNNYYHGCTVNGTAVTSGEGCLGADITDNNGALPAYRLDLGANITTPPGTFAGQTEWLDTPPVGARLAPENGFTLAGNHYFASGYVFTPGSTLASGAAQGYTPRATLGDVLLDLYTPTGDTDPLAGTAIARLTITADCDGKTLKAAIRSDGLEHEVSYMTADGTAQTAQAVALDGTEKNLAAGWYFVGQPTVAFDHTLNLGGDVNLILVDGKTMKVRITKERDCISAEGHSLHIYGQTEGTGALNAQTNGKRVVVIRITNGTLGIHGGNVKAYAESTDNTKSAIHVERATAGDALVIDRGTLTANSKNSCGIYIEGGDVRINGGQVTATGAESGIDISDNEDVAFSIPGILTLSGGTLTASSFYTSSGESYEGTLAIAPGLTYTDGTSLYDSTTETATLAALAGKTLRPGLTARQAPDGNYWTTYYNGALGFTIDADENACAYTATYGGSQLTLHKLGKEIPKNTAVIIVADNNVVSMTAATTLPAYSGSTNDLRGVDVDTDVDDITSDLGDGTFYVLGMTTVNGEQHFGFHRYTGEEMAAHKAFVFVGNSPAQSAPSLTMVFDEASGIESLTPDAAPKAQAAEHWFTLDGRRLQAKPTAPGIYINNGRKVVIK